MAESWSYRNHSLTELVANADPDLKGELVNAKGLREFLNSIDRLESSELEAAVEQAIILLESFYVHLPLKRAMHAVDPVQKLKLLRRRMSQMNSEIEFHDEMTEIFTSVRDLHTNYILPSHFARMVAFLPFRVKRCVDGGQSKYIVTDLMPGFNADPTFIKGVEVTAWSGVPIERAVEIAANYHAGSNPAARLARGIDGLTLRTMNVAPPPDEEWVVVTYRSLDPARTPIEFRADWTVTTLPTADPVTEAWVNDAAAASFGLDIEGDTRQRAFQLLFVPDIAAASRKVESDRLQAEVMAEAVGGDAKAAGTRAAESAAAGFSTILPKVLQADIVPHAGRTFAYIRIRTFSVSDDVLLSEMIRLLEHQDCPPDGLILDVRGNGGGLIWAGERLLQLFTPKVIEPCRVQFINTPLVQDLVRSHDSFMDWRLSMTRALETGAAYSAAYPITPPERCNDVGQSYHGPVVLITDARCYSTTDIFAAGFQDHGIGLILGVDNNTGAGGANVWTADLINKFFGQAGLPLPLKGLQSGSAMRVAIRRTLRVGPEQGTELEDLGVTPEELHKPTRRDLLEADRDLLERAAELMPNQAVRRFSIKSLTREPAAVTVDLVVTGLDRVDAYVNDRPLATQDVAGGTARFSLAAASGDRIEMRGFDKGSLAGCRKAIAP